jgi:hypothetical protein
LVQQGIIFEVYPQHEEGELWTITFTGGY